LTAPFNQIFRRKIYILIDFPLSLFNETANISTSDITLNSNKPFIPFSAYYPRADNFFYSGYGYERDLPAAREADKQIFDLVNIISKLWFKPKKNIKPFLFFIDLAKSYPPYRRFNSVLDIPDILAMPRNAFPL